MLAASRRPYNPNRTSTDNVEWDKTDLQSFLNTINCIPSKDIHITNKPIEYYKDAPKEITVAEIIGTFNLNHYNLLTSIKDVLQLNRYILHTTENRNRTIGHCVQRIKKLESLNNRIHFLLVRAAHILPDVTLNQYKQSKKLENIFEITSCNDISFTDTDFVTFEENINEFKSINKNNNNKTNMELPVTTEIPLKNQPLQNIINISNTNSSGDAIYRPQSPRKQSHPHQICNETITESKSCHTSTTIDATHDMAASNSIVDEEKLDITNTTEISDNIQSKPPQKQAKQLKSHTTPPKPLLLNKQTKPSPADLAQLLAYANSRAHSRETIKSEKEPPHKLQNKKLKQTKHRKKAKKRNKKNKYKNNNKQQQKQQYHPKKPPDKNYTSHAGLNPLRKDIAHNFRYIIYNEEKKKQDEENIMPYCDYIENEQKAYDELNEKINYKIYAQLLAL